MLKQLRLYLSHRADKNQQRDAAIPQPENVPLPVHSAESQPHQGIQPLNGDGLQQMTARKQFELGYHFFEQGEFEAAIVHCRRAIEYDPQLTDAYHYLAEALRELGNLAEAAHFYRQAIELTEQQGVEERSADPTHESIHEFADTSIHESINETINTPAVEEAVAETNSLAWQVPESAEPADSHSTEPQPDRQAVVVWQMPQSAQANLPVADLELAEQCYRREQWQEAIDHCQAAIKVQPSVAAYKLMGNTLQRMGRFEPAMDAYLEAIQLEPGSAEIHANLGSLYAQQQRWQDAVVYFQSAIALKPDFAGAYRNLARVWSQLGKLNHATECWYQAMQLEPEQVPPEEQFNLGNLLLGRDQVEEAIDCYCRAVQFDPEWVEAYQALAEAYSRQQLWKEAVECYRKIQELTEPVNSALLQSLLPALPATQGSGNGSGSAAPGAIQNGKPKQDVAQLPLLRRGGKDLAEVVSLLRQRNTTRFGTVEEQLEEAEDYFEQEQWDEAIAASEAALQQLEPEMVQAYRNLANALYAKNEVDEAIRYYRRVVELEPEASADWVNLGSLYAQLQQWQGAIHCYQTALKINPKLASAHWNLAKVWNQTGQLEQGSDAMLLALSLEPDWASVQEHLQLCHTLLHQGKTDAAAICYRQVIEQDMSCAEAQFALAELLARREQWSEALTHYRQAVQAEKTNARYLARLGDALARLEDWDGAIETYRQVIALEPEQPQYYRTLATCLEQRQAWNELIDCYQRLAMLQPEDADLYHKLGDLLNQQQRWQEAISAFQRAIELHPEFSWSHNNLGDALLHLERWQEAAEAYRKAINLNPEFHWSHYNLGEALAKLEDWDGAIEAYRRALNLQSNLPQISQKLGDALFYRAKIDLDVALDYYEQAIQANPDDEQTYHRALEIQPNNPKFYLGLSNALMQKGKMHDATVFFQMLQQLELNADDRAVANQLQNLLPCKEDEFSNVSGTETTSTYEALAYYQEGKSLVEQLRWAEALLAYRKALQLNSNIEPEWCQEFLGDFLKKNTVWGQKLPLSKEATKSAQEITVVVPIYNAYDDTRRCIEALLKQTTIDCKILLIDDCSQDDRILPFLTEIALGNSQVTFFKNPQNLGFVRTCNLAFHIAKDRDVVLLNSDTIVTANWLEKLRDAAYSHPQIASVTPLTNNGEICSVPDWLCSNYIPEGETIESFATLIEKISLRRYPAIPTAVGFCVYLKRQALDEVGYLDELHFGKGYGEENDWSCRATDAGYHHILDDSTFIYHAGGKSFGVEEKQQLVLNNFKPLEKLHPTYFKDIHDFINTKPLQDILSNIKLHLTLERMRRLSPICFVLHNGVDIPVNSSLGGTEYHCSALVSNIKNIRPIYVLCLNSDEGYLALSIFFKEEIHRFVFPGFLQKDALLSHQIDELFSQRFINLLQYLKPSIIHIHHLKGFSIPSVVDALLQVEIPYLVSFHDYYLICPSYNLIDASGRFCYEHKTESYCRSCIQSLFNEGMELKQQWSYQCERLLTGASVGIAPSETSRSYFVREYPQLSNKFQVIRHGVTKLASLEEWFNQRNLLDYQPTSPIRIAFVGGINAAKGLDLIIELAEKVRMEPTLAKKFEFSLYGETSSQIPDTANIKTHTRYERENLPLLLQATDVVMFPAVWAETYCLVADEVLALGIPVISTPLGAIAERIRTFNLGWISRSCSADDLLAVLRVIANNPQELVEIRRNIQRYPLLSYEAMSRQYLELYESYGLRSDTNDDFVGSNLMPQSLFFANLNATWLFGNR